MAEDQSQLSEKGASKDKNSYPMHVKLKWLMIVLLAFLFGGIGGYANMQAANREPQSITVAGEGMISAMAEKAVIAGSTYTTASDAVTAVSNDKLEIENIKESLAERGLSVSSFVVNGSTTDQGYGGGSGGEVFPLPTLMCLGSCPSPMEQPNGSTQGNVIPTSMPAYYSYTNFEITVQGSDVAKIDSYIDVLTKANTNPNISYSFNTKLYANTLAELALADAKIKAENIAKINKARLKKVLSVTEQQNYYGQNSMWENLPNKEVKLSAVYMVKFELAYPLFF